jgi:hypothetical protein
LAGMLANNVLFVAATLALVASFLSAFNGALLSAVQIGIILRRRTLISRELRTFHWLTAGMLMVVSFAFLALLSANNPYLLANVLLGPYAIIAGTLVGSVGFVSKMRDGSLLWVAVLSLLVWFFYITSRGSIAAVPNTYEINTVPAGVFVFVGVAVSSWLLRSGKVTR